MPKNLYFFENFYLGDIYCYYFGAFTIIIFKIIIPKHYHLSKTKTNINKKRVNLIYMVYNLEHK